MSHGPTGESGPPTKCPPLLYIPNEASTPFAPRGYKGAHRGVQLCGYSCHSRALSANNFCHPNASTIAQRRAPPWSPQAFKSFVGTNWPQLLSALLTLPRTLVMPLDCFAFRLLVDAWHL
uniref:Uncharacterized protein n=1 Tax=Ananas comosus var. bracteatus TaxID=296719 RepID=A0A6V7P2Q5_ANACO|nr:unnamed protein product [Ananas comosus var. bracteatus]